MNNPPYLQTVQFENGNLSNPSQGRPAAQAPFGTVNALDPNLETPYSMNFSFSVQRELPRGFLVEGAYIGNVGRHLVRGPDINQAPFSALISNAALPAAQRASVNALRPYKGFSAINMRLSDSTSNYHSMQLYVNKRAGNIQLTGSYTWSKVLTDASSTTDNPENFEDRHFSYGPATFDRRHIFVATYTYHVPFGRTWNRPVKFLLAGWDLSGINRFQTGPYYTVSGTTSIGGRRADYRGGDVALPDDERSVARYINTAAFAPAPDTRRGNSGVGIVAGPSLFLWDLSIRKEFAVTERLKIKFQGDMFNLPNHTNFSRVDYGFQLARFRIHFRVRTRAQHSVRAEGAVLMTSAVGQASVCGGLQPAARTGRNLFHQGNLDMRKFLIPATALAAVLLSGQQYTDPVIRTDYHLTARPWKPLAIPRAKYLEAIEGECRFSIRHQNSEGAIIDPFIKREHQYATPYFAYAVGTLVAAGRAMDLLPYGIKAMEHTTANFAAGVKAIPDQHGEFFIPALTGALELYAGKAPAETLKTWRERMKTPRKDVVRGSTNNWETYPMKGEWMRVLAGLAGRDQAVDFIEEAWRARHKGRMAPAPWNLYHDRTSDPDTLNVEAVGRGNLLALASLGYDGPSGAEIRKLVEAGTQLTMYLQDPSGQTPTNGRTDDHVWVDVGYQLCFEVMAENAHKRGDAWLAGQFRHAAMQAFQNIARWRRSDGPWAGSYYVTKNHFDPALRVGYQPASEYSNYNGSLMYHLAEAAHTRVSEITEHPSPTEIGGYTIATDKEFASVFANAGGFLMQANLRGQLPVTHANRWTPLGVVRFARVGWDTRLGPSDGALTADTVAEGVTFAPTFSEQGRWLRMASLAERYEGSWSVQFVHPVLVRCAIDYRPKQGQSGPSFRNEFTLTPDAILSVVTKTAGDAAQWGVTWPLLENDGAPLTRSDTAQIASVRYPGGADQQNFIAVDAKPGLTPEKLLRSTYGDLRPIRVTVDGEKNRTLIYPRGAGDPEAEAVRKSFVARATGFDLCWDASPGTPTSGGLPQAASGNRLTSMAMASPT